MSSSYITADDAGPDSHPYRSDVWQALYLIENLTDRLVFMRLGIVERLGQSRREGPLLLGLLFDDGAHANM